MSLKILFLACCSTTTITTTTTTTTTTTAATTWCQKANSHVNDLKKYTTKNIPGWTINVKYVKSKMFNGAYWRGCDGDNSWFGWGGNGYIETTLHGCGRACLDFGNCAQCKVYVQLCGKTIATHCFASKKVCFDYKEGDVLRLSHCTSNAGIIKFNSFKVIHCCSTTPDDGWTLQKILQ